MSETRVVEIISSGLPGADQGALTFAIINQLDYSGFTPFDPSGKAMEEYPLLEEVKTEKDALQLNVATADAVIAVAIGKMSYKNEASLIKTCKKLEKPLYFYRGGPVEALLDWIDIQPGQIKLMVTGHSSAEATYAQEHGFDVLEKISAAPLCDFDSRP